MVGEIRFVLVGTAFFLSVFFFEFFWVGASFFFLSLSFNIEKFCSM